MNVDLFKELEVKYLKYLNAIEEQIKYSPYGRIRILNRDGNISYYFCEYGDNNGTYLPKEKKENMALIKQLANKKYCKLLLPVVKKDVDALRSCIYKASKLNMSDVYDNLPLGIKEFVQPYELSDSEYCEHWLNAPYQKSTRPIVGGYKTQSGETVRSKSELIIADKLFELGIPFKYEKQINIPNYGSFAPDFTILKKQTKQIFIWEHFGLMDDNEYRKKAFEKIAMYTNYETLTGIKFISTFECSSYNLDASYIDNIIKNYFL